MPSRSPAEHRFWGAMKSHPEEARARGIKPGTAEEFLSADRGRHFQQGGPVPQRKPAFMHPKFG